MRGYNSLIAVHPEAEVTDLRARQFSINFDEAHRFLRDRMKDAQDVMSYYANQDRMATALFCIGDRLYVRVDHIWMGRTARKLVEKKIGPFPINYQPSAMPFTLRLSSTIHIHPVFYMSQLGPDYTNTFGDCNQQPSPPLIVDGQHEYLIERIIEFGFAAIASHSTTSNGSAIPYPTIPSTGSSRTILTTLEDKSSPRRITQNMPTSLARRN